MNQKTQKSIFTLLVIMLLNVGFTQTLKTFSGPFADGKANYTYYSDEYGNEVLQGKFSYSGVVKAEKATATCTITGTFKDGKRNGRWEFKTGGQGSYTKNIFGTYAKYIMNSSIDVIATYSNGVLDGEFTLTKIQNDYIPDLGQNGHINSDVRCKFKFKDGVLDGKFMLVDKDDDEPQNMSGMVKNGYFEGLISDDGKEIVFQDGVMIKNQNWDKESQDKLKITHTNFMPFMNSEKDIQMENNFRLQERCESYPSTLIDKYIDVFYASTDFLHSDIGGDDGYKSSGCYFYIEDLGNLADFKTSEHSKRLDELANNKDVFGFVTYYSKQEYRFTEYKPSSLTKIQQQHKEMLMRIPDALAEQKTLLTKQNEFTKEVQEFTEKVNSNTLDLISSSPSTYRVIIDRSKLVFKFSNGQSNLPGRYLLSLISNETKDALNEINREYFTNPIDKSQHEIINVAQENKLKELQEVFAQLKTNITQLILDEEKLISLLITLKDETKKGTSERILAEFLINRFDENVHQFHQEKITPEQYISQIQEINQYYTTALSLLKQNETIVSTKTTLESELKNAKIQLETSFLNYILANMNQVQVDFTAFQTKIDSKSKTELLEKTKEIESQLNKMTELKKQVGQLKESIAGFEAAKTQILNAEFIDKNLSKTVKSLIESKAQIIQEKYIQNKALIISKENYQSTINDFQTEITNQLNLISNLQKLQTRELSKEEAKNLKKVKDNQEELIKLLLSF